MNAQDPSNDCCPRQNATTKKSYIGAASFISASGAAGLAGIGCLGCIPFLGTALAASSFASILDENLQPLQIALITISAGLSLFYFRKTGFSKLQLFLTYSTYLALTVNALFLEKRSIGIALIVVLAIAHILKKQQVVLKLLYFQGCPTYPELKRELDHHRLLYQEIDLEHLENNDPLRNHSSPTLMFRDEILFGTSLSSGSMSCTFDSQKTLKAAVKRAIALSVSGKCNQ